MDLWFYLPLKWRPNHALCVLHHLEPRGPHPIAAIRLPPPRVLRSNSAEQRIIVPGKKPNSYHAPASHAFKSCLTPPPPPENTVSSIGFLTLIPR
jgi:hypothetical protein